MAALVDLLPPAGSDPSAVLDAFATWAADGGRPLYPHQEEAALALAAGDHVVLATPTGSGKSLVAIAGILLARNEGRRAVWTAPIKALVAEKFFDLVDLLGAEQRRAGDRRRGDQRRRARCSCARPRCSPTTRSSTGPASDFGFACLDEFHYYGDARPRLGVAGPAARADQLPDAAGLGDARRHDRDHHRPRRALRPRR